MSERQSLIGFTEAELGFFLVLLCVVLWVVTTAALPGKPADIAPTPSSAPVTISRDSLAHLLKDRARLATTIRSRDSLRLLVDSLKSPILPSCQSRGIADGPLLRLTAIGGGQYRKGDETISVEDIAGRTTAARVAAQAKQCLHEVVLDYQAGLSASDYESSRRELRALHGMRPVSGSQVTP